MIVTDMKIGILQGRSPAVSEGLSFLAPPVCSFTIDGLAEQESRWMALRETHVICTRKTAGESDDDGDEGSWFLFCVHTDSGNAQPRLH